MAIRRRNANLLDDLNFNSNITEELTLRKQQPVDTKTRKFQSKLDSKSFGSFDHTDWRKYFQKMYLESTGTSYKILGQSMNVKTKAIITSLMKDYEPTDIKLVIDFLFLADHDVEHTKDEITIYHLSRGWITSILPKAKLWQKGTYKKKSIKTNNTRVREWTGTTATNNDEEIF